MLILKNISKEFGEFRLTDIDIEIPEKAYYILLGRSGSGKTRLLELIAGFDKPDSGDIWLDGENITKKKIQERGIGLVFQDYAIFPNMNVYNNIAYSLNSERSGRDQVKEKVRNIAEELGIFHILERRTDNLSAGELQRVALARTLIKSPRLLLLDEPMASIDATLKDEIKRLLHDLNRKGLTIIHVTHDYKEALGLANRIGVIHNGRIIQEGNPDEVFRQPANKFVARYSGIKNFFNVKFKNGKGECKAFLNEKLVFDLPPNSYASEGLLAIRNDEIRIWNKEPSLLSVNCFKGVVKNIFPSETGMEIAVDAGTTFYADVSADTFKNQPVSEFSEVWITFPREAVIPLKE